MAPMTMLRMLSTIGAAAALGLMTGFFFAFSNPTMMGFAAIDGATYVAGMQAINIAVRNTAFFIAFAAPLPLALVAALVSRQRLAWLAAAACYGGAIAVTASVNIPINEDMALWDPAALPAEWQDLRDRWTAANHLRGVLTGIGFLAALWALARQPNG